MPPATEPSNRRSTPLRAGEREQLGAVVRDELLVGGHDGLAGGERAAHPAAGRIEPADEFHDDVGVRLEHVVGALGPRHVAGDPRRALPRDVAVEDVGQAHAGRRLLGQDPGDGLADGAETEERDTVGVGRGPGALGDHGRNLELCGRSGRSVKFMVITER